MKKQFILSVLFILCGVFFSCAEKITPELATNKLITFDTPLVSIPTKAAVISGTEYPTTQDFKVYAKYHSNDMVTWSTATDYFTATGSTVTYTADVNGSRDGWKPTPTDYYWPKTGKLSFVAYSPATASPATVTETGVKFTNYAVELGKDAQPDLLFSERVLNKQENAEVGTDLYGVQIPFKHALSQVAFTAKLKDDSGITDPDWVKIKSVTLKGVSTVASFNQNLVDAAAGPHGIPAWTGHGTVSNYANIVEDPSVKLTNTLNSDNYCPVLVLPQDFTDNTTVEVIYDMFLNGITETDVTVEVKLNTFTYSGGNGNKFVIGKKYIYNIVFGVEKIYFAPTVTDWDVIDVTENIVL